MAAPCFFFNIHNFLHTFMSNVIAENDEPIHHSEGKTILRSCPSVLTFAQSGESYPLISISPPVTISPPDLQHVLGQRKLVWDEQSYSVQNNIIIVNQGGNLFVEGMMVNTMIIHNYS